MNRAMKLYDDTAHDAYVQDMIQANREAAAMAANRAEQRRRVTDGRFRKWLRTPQGLRFMHALVILTTIFALFAGIGYQSTTLPGWFREHFAEALTSTFALTMFIFGLAVVAREVYFKIKKD